MRQPSAERPRGDRHNVDEYDDRGVGQHVRRIGRGRHRTERFERDPARADARALIDTCCFGPFCGDKAAEPDTEDGRGDARDGSKEAARDDREDDRDGETREDRAPDDRRCGSR